MIWIRRSPDLSKNIKNLRVINKRIDFWEFYSRYLTYIALCRSEDENPNFENNKVTRFFEEIIQANGSQWLLSLALASAIEGIAKLIAKPEDLQSDYKPQDIDELRKHLSIWEGSEILKNRIYSDIERLKVSTISSFLGRLVDRKIIGQEHRKSWNELRNKIMHGGLNEPWIDEESYDKILKLLELVVILTIDLYSK